MNLSIKSLLLASTFAFSSIATTAAYATNIDVVVHANEGGNAWRNGELVRNALNAKGYGGTIVATGSTCNAITHMDADTETPMILIHDDSNLVEHGPKGCGIEPTVENIIAPLYDRLQAVCVRKDEGIADLAEFIASRERVTVGTSEAVPAIAIQQLEELTGTRLVRVPYESSGDLLRGHIAGDTDLIYAGLTQREATNEEIVCLTTSADDTVNGIPPMSTVYPDWNYASLGSVHYVYGRNFTPELREQLRADIFDIIENDPEVSNFIAVSGMVPGTEIDFDLDFFYNRVKQWSGE